MIAVRRETAPEGSYTARLFDETGLLDAKLLEEAQELVDAQGADDVAHEAADLIYHAWVLLAEAGVTPEQVRQELAGRAGTSGLDEKKNRSGSKIQDPGSKV